MKLRRATAADAAKLALIGSATFLETFANDHDGEEVVRFVADEHSIAAYDKALADPANAFWIVEEAAGSPVGYATLVRATLPHSAPEGDLELKRIYLLSKWQGGGWGGKLYAAVEDEARARGARRLLLSVYVLNYPAQKFYAARGYVSLGKWIFKGFDASEDFIYAKTL